MVVVSVALTSGGLLRVPDREDLALNCTNDHDNRHQHNDDDTVAPDELAGPASDVCREFASSPFPERRGFLETAAGEAGTTADQLLTVMKDLCADAVATFSDLEKIATMSAGLTDAGGNYLVGSNVGCGDQISAVLTNETNDPIGLVVGMYRGTDSSGLDAAAIVIVPSLDAGEQIEIDKAIGSPDMGCLVVSRPFVAARSEATDTWDPPSDARPLPATTGDDWLTMLQALIETEQITGGKGPTAEFGMTEDVRSAEYPRLVSSTPEPDAGAVTEITEICDATSINDSLVNITYVATRDGEPYTASGLFRKSPQDGRWRWLQLAFYLSDGNACSALTGVSVASTGQSA